MALFQAFPQNTTFPAQSHTPRYSSSIFFFFFFELSKESIYHTKAYFEAWMEVLYSELSFKIWLISPLFTLISTNFSLLFSLSRDRFQYIFNSVNRIFVEAQLRLLYVIRPYATRPNLYISVDENYKSLFLCVKA